MTIGDSIANLKGPRGNGVQNLKIEGDELTYEEIKNGAVQKKSAGEARGPQGLPAAEGLATGEVIRDHVQLPGEARDAVDERAKLTARKTLAPTDIVWPQGLVALWMLNPEHATPEGHIRSAAGVEEWIAERVSGQTVFDYSEPGPFGPALRMRGMSNIDAWVVGGLDPSPEAIGRLDLSMPDTGFTVISWVKTKEGNSEMAFRHGSHIESGVNTARQYGGYYNGGGPTKYRHVPHLGAQDGPTPGFKWNYDYPASARQYWNRWTMEVGTFDGVRMDSYVDGLRDILDRFTSQDDGAEFNRQVNISKNPYFPVYGSGGINPSSKRKAYSIGAAIHGSEPLHVTNATRGLMSGAAVFNRALTPTEVMSIRLQTLMPGEPVALFDFFYSNGSSFGVGAVAANELGWKSIGGAHATDYSYESPSTPTYRISVPTSPNFGHLVRVGDSDPAVTFFGLEGLRTPQIRRATVNLLSTFNAPPQRLLLKVGTSWFASEQTIRADAEHADATDWPNAEPKSFDLDLGAGKWRPCTFSETGTGATYTSTFSNFVARPSGEAATTPWSGWSALAHNGATVSEAEGTYSGTGDKPRADAGSKYRRYTVTASPSSPGFSIMRVFAGLPFTPGSTTHGGVFIRPSRTVPLVAQLNWLADNGSTSLGTTNGITVTAPANVWTFVPVVGTPPASSTKANVTIGIPGSGTTEITPTGTTFDADCAIVTQGQLPPPDHWFDGSSEGGSWASTVGASQSTKTYTIEGSPPITLGPVNASRLPANALNGIGFYSPAGTGTHRLKNLALWRV